MLGFNTIKNKISSALKNNSRKPSFQNFSEIKKILILFTYEDWNDISKIALDLEHEGKEVVLWAVFLQHSETNKFIFPANVRIITQKDKSKLRGLSTTAVDEFKKLECDALLDLTTHDDKIIQYLLAHNSAKFCIGIRQQEFEFFDFTLLTGDNINLKETYKQIKFYLNNMC